jgi:6,7-dimethyl-8-ribityllumazine synthase
MSERDGWPESPSLEDPPSEEDEAPEAEVDDVEVEAVEVEEAEEVEADAEPAESEPAAEVQQEEIAETESPEHAAGDFFVPDGYGLLEGKPQGGRRAVGVVVSRFNGEITNRLLERALEELEEIGVPREAIMVMPVPGAFELPLAAMALAKTRRYACVVALGCVIRGETPHFDYVASEAASGLQLAAIETGVPVSFGVLTVDTREQAEERIDRAADAVRTALEMADVFSQLRAQAAGGLH